LGASSDGLFGIRNLLGDLLLDSSSSGWCVLGIEVVGRISSLKFPLRNTLEPGKLFGSVFSNGHGFFLNRVSALLGLSELV
jgi:hypothetical protein